MCKILYNIHITYFIVILSHLSDVSTYNLQIVVKLCKLLVVYGPADLTVHHPPPPPPLAKLSRVGLFFLCICV